MQDKKKIGTSGIIRIEGKDVNPKYEGYFVFEDLFLSRFNEIENTRSGSTHAIIDSVKLMEIFQINSELTSISSVIIEPIYNSEMRLFLKVTNPELIIVTDRYSGKR